MPIKVIRVKEDNLDNTKNHHDLTYSLLFNNSRIHLQIQVDSMLGFETNFNKFRKIKI